MSATTDWIGSALFGGGTVDGLPGLLAQAGGADASRGMLGYDLTSVFVFTIFGIVFVVVTVSVLSRLLRPSARPGNEPSKLETYECGEPAIGSSWVRFDIRFYTLALIFLIFDVEVAFLFPWAVIFKDLRVEGVGLFAFTEVMIFIAILMAGFVYCWVRGDLDWIKSLRAQAEDESGGGVVDPGGREVSEEAATTS